MEFHSCRSSGVRPRSSSLNFSSKKSCLSLFTAAFVRTDGTDSTANGDGENGDTANPTGDTDGITDPAADDSGDNTDDSGDNTGDAENV